MSETLLITFTVLITTQATCSEFGGKQGTCSFLLINCSHATAKQEPHTAPYFLEVLKCVQKHYLRNYQGTKETANIKALTFRISV